MLILTRKSDETVWIGENICIMVTEVKDKQVKLDIQAPGAVKSQANIRSFSKKLDDTISIGENISIKIVEVRGKQVRLGISAPAKMLVLRGEEKFPDNRC
jgi:sRNA-binding carbon storage regulator CsrA